MTITMPVQRLVQRWRKHPPLETCPKMTLMIQTPISSLLIRPPIPNQRQKRSQPKQHLEVA